MGATNALGRLAHIYQMWHSTMFTIQLLFSLLLHHNFILGEEYCHIAVYRALDDKGGFPYYPSSNILGLENRECRYADVT